jgi:uncharacterized protein YciI
MSHWLYMLRPTRLAMVVDGPTEEEARIVGEHFAHLRRLVGEGVVLLAGRTQDAGPETRGLVILEAPDEAAARRIMESDPAVAGGVMTATLQPYAIALAGRIAPTP